MWGAVLFELREGIERVCLIDAKEKVGEFTYATFEFQLSDALLPELYRIVSTPVVLENFRAILASLKRVDFFQRTANAASGRTSWERMVARVDPRFLTSIVFARDALSRGLVEKFNLLVRIGNAIGEATFGEDWNADAAGLLPPEIDASSVVEESVP